MLVIESDTFGILRASTSFEWWLNLLKPNERFIGEPWEDSSFFINLSDKKKNSIPKSKVSRQADLYKYIFISIGRPGYGIHVLSKL